MKVLCTFKTPYKNRPSLAHIIRAYTSCMKLLTVLFVTLYLNGTFNDDVSAAVAAACPALLMVKHTSGMRAEPQ